MARTMHDLDVSDNPALLRAAENVHSSNQPLTLRAGARVLAMLVPIAGEVPMPTSRDAEPSTAPHAADTAAARRARTRAAKDLSVVERTAGIFRAYVRQPILTAEEERAAAEQAIADDVVARMRE